MRTIELNNIKENELINYGFIYKDNSFYYEKNINNNKFKVIIEIKNELKSKVIDNNTNEEYIMVDLDTATGNYVGKIKKEYECIILDIINKCSSKEIYHQKQTKNIINYINKTYHDKPEFLWKKFKTTSAIRNKNNKKWYAAFMTIELSKLEIDSNEIEEIVVIKYQKGKTSEIINNKSIFPGYHMNKQSWITIILNNTLDNEIIYSLIDNSYELSLK